MNCNFIISNKAPSSDILSKDIINSSKELEGCCALHSSKLELAIVIKYSIKACAGYPSSIKKEHAASLSFLLDNFLLLPLSNFIITGR